MAQMMNGFSRKQAGVIYRAMKQGQVSITKSAVAYMYDLTEGGIDWNGQLNQDIQSFRLAVDAIFENDYEKAQKHIDWIIEHDSRLAA